MQMTVDCPGCHKPLRVPQSAGGRRARCPRCRAKFVIPSPKDLLEDTISNWIVEDVEKSRDDEDPAPSTSSSNPADRTMMGVAEDTGAFEGVSSAVGSSSSRVYPTDFRWNDHPRLVVRGCSLSGVKLAFNSRWLELDAFCASMPIGCVFSGQRDRASLCARPMIFFKYYRGPADSVRTIESTYERHLSEYGSALDLVRGINRLADMQPPFDHPLVYFASLRHGDEHLQCSCLNEADGAITCEVIVPDGQVALDWLGQVNGICGREYEMLATDISRLSSEQWQTLSEACHDRLEKWCRFQSRENLQVYLRDADLDDAEDGRAGVVVTDRRVIYHKYHRLGSIPLDQEADLLVKSERGISRLALRSKGHVMRIGKIRSDELPRLQSCLANSKLRMRLA